MDFFMVRRISNQTLKLLIINISGLFLKKTFSAQRSASGNKKARAQFKIAPWLQKPDSVFSEICRVLK